MNRRIRNRTRLSIAAGVLLSVAAEARADPCAARLPDRAGQSFSGRVRYIVDGDGLCVGGASDPATWIEVRLADFDAPELNASGGQRAKALLARVTRGRSLVCTATRGRSGRVVVHDRVIAVCTRDGRRLGDLLREAGGVRGGN